MGYIQNWSGNSGYAANTMHVTYNVNASTAVAGKIVPDGAEHFDQCKYGGRCHHCDRRIEPGDSIWWVGRDNTHSRSRIWCASHKTKPATVGAEHDEEQDDMAQRQDFTFPYTGQEIADSLERKAAKLDAQQKPEVRLDRNTAALLGYSSDREYEELVSSKQGVIDRENKRLATEAAALRKEAIPYAKAGSKASFDIDLEDIEHFGLNDDDAPAPKKVRRKRAESAPAEAEAVPA